jgi:hypothetical protein
VSQFGNDLPIYLVGLCKDYSNEKKENQTYITAEQGEGLKMRIGAFVFSYFKYRDTLNAMQRNIKT